MLVFGGVYRMIFMINWLLSAVKWLLHHSKNRGLFVFLTATIYDKQIII